MIKVNVPLLMIFVLLLLSIASCRFSEDFYEKDDAIVSFSRDTLQFDTVFTSIGSATRSFKIYNPYSDALLLTSVSLEKGEESFFRLNVNGVPGTSVEGVEIPPNDSIYVFAEVTIDPDMDLTASPFIIEEALMVEVNGNKQQIQLEAWGQNANYIPSSDAKGRLSLLSCDLETIVWDDEKPYVIYGILFIDSCTLELPPDCKVYVHGGIGFTEERSTYNDGRIIVLKDGSLVTNGTVDQPVIIQGDRLEPEFEQIPAQWYGIQIFPESRNNIFRNTVIKDGITGLSLDSMSEASLDAVDISNHASRSLVSFHVGQLSIQNSLFHSAQAETILIKYGGNVNIDYSTITSYEANQNAALYADNFRCTDDIFCAPILLNPLNLKVRNSAVSGQSSDELVIVDASFGEDPSLINFAFQNSALRIDTLLNVFPTFFDNCEGCFTIDQSENLFMDENDDDFRLDTLSQLEMRAFSIPGVTTDFLGIDRDALSPDVGCYEYVE